jgi:hypothetical protein
MLADHGEIVLKLSTGHRPSRLVQNLGTVASAVASICPDKIDLQGFAGYRRGLRAVFGQQPVVSMRCSDESWASRPNSVSRARSMAIVG